MTAQWIVSENAQAASAACTRKIIELLGRALESRDRASLAISGGTTPRLMFQEMAKTSFDWSRVHLFWVDERMVPPTDPESNYKLAKENFIDAAHFPPGNVHRVHGELAPEEAVKSYIKDMQAFFQLAPGEVPQIDVIHRGMGPDAHTASLFPDSPLIDDRTKLAGAIYVEKFHQWRVTLLPGVLEAARNTLILAAGADKAEPLKAVLESPYDPKKYPSQIATYAGHPGAEGALWFLDKAAARLIA